MKITVLLCLLIALGSNARHEGLQMSGKKLDSKYIYDTGGLKTNEALDIPPNPDDDFPEKADDDDDDDNGVNDLAQLNQLLDDDDESDKNGADVGTEKRPPIIDLEHDIIPAKLNLKFADDDGDVGEDVETDGPEKLNNVLRDDDNGGSDDSDDSDDGDSDESDDDDSVDTNTDTTTITTTKQPNTPIFDLEHGKIPAQSNEKFKLRDDELKHDIMPAAMGLRNVDSDKTGADVGKDRRSPDIDLEHDMIPAQLKLKANEKFNKLRKDELKQDSMPAAMGFRAHLRRRKGLVEQEGFCTFNAASTMDAFDVVSSVVFSENIFKLQVHSPFEVLVPRRRGRWGGRRNRRPGRGRRGRRQGRSLMEPKGNGPKELRRGGRRFGPRSNRKFWMSNMEQLSIGTHNIRFIFWYKRNTVPTFTCILGCANAAATTTTTATTTTGRGGGTETTSTATQPTTGTTTTQSTTTSPTTQPTTGTTTTQSTTTSPITQPTTGTTTTQSTTTSPTTQPTTGTTTTQSTTISSTTQPTTGTTTTQSTTTSTTQPTTTSTTQSMTTQSTTSSTTTTAAPVPPAS